MATSAQLYAEKAALLEEQQELIEAKTGLDTNVETFITTCSNVSIQANAIKNYCSSSNDTNLKESASDGGSSAQLSKGIDEVISNMEAAISAADAAMQADIDSLGEQAAQKGREAAAAALRESLAKKYTKYVESPKAKNFLEDFKKKNEKK